MGSNTTDEPVIATYRNAGARADDISNTFRPIEVGRFDPPGPEETCDTRPGRPGAIQSTDVYLEEGGRMYGTDYSGGLYTPQFEGEQPSDDTRTRNDVRDILDADCGLFDE